MSFSKEPPFVQQQQFNFINVRWGQLSTLVKEWTEKAVQFLTFTNAGGAVAVLSFMGASNDVRKMIWPRIALCCFAAGVICTGIFIAKQFHRMEKIFARYRRDSERYLSDQIEWDTLSMVDEDRSDASCWDYFWGYAPFILFVLGCVAGGISLFGHKSF
jgi:hypothetical protein